MRDIVDEFIEQQSYFRLTEMALPLAKIEQKLLAGSDVRDIHLLKIYYFRDFTDYLHGWINTVWKLAVRVCKDKKTNKLPPKDVIYECLFGCEEDIFFDHLSGTFDDFNYKDNPDYKYLPSLTDISKEGAFSFCKEYYLWVAEGLSQNGEIRYPEAKGEILALLEKYPYKIQ